MGFPTVNWRLRKSRTQPGPERQSTATQRGGFPHSYKQPQRHSRRSRRSEQATAETQSVPSYTALSETYCAVAGRCQTARVQRQKESRILPPPRDIPQNVSRLPSRRRGETASWCPRRNARLQKPVLARSARQNRGLLPCEEREGPGR